MIKNQSPNNLWTITKSTNSKELILIISFI